MECSSAWASPEDFEFNTCAAGVDVKGADDLFYKGQLLPLALPPRLQMVHSLSVREEECEEAAAVAALAGAGAAPWLHMACPPAQATGDEAMARARQQRGWRSSGPPTLSLRATVPPPSQPQQQQVKSSSGFRRGQDSVGSRHFWGDSSAQPSSDSSADSSSEARDSSGSSKDSLDLSAPEKGDSVPTSSNSQCGYTAGQRARHDKFFHALVALGGKSGAQSELPGGHGDGRHARVFSWLKPASSRWNGIFGSSKKAGHAAKKMAAMEDDGDGRVRTSASLGRPASPPRDSSSSDDLPTAPSRFRHSGPLASCDDEFLVNCRDRLSGPLSFRGSAAMRDPVAVKCDWEGVRASHDLAEERREWQSMHSSFRESAADPFLSDSISAVDGHHSGREHWRMNPSFNYEDACHEEQQQVPGLNDASRSSDKAAKRRNWGTLVTDSGGRHRYLDKLFRSFHVRIPLKSSESLPKTKSSRRNQTNSANVPMMLNPICSTSTEKQSAIQGAIAYCKRSQSTQGSCKPKGVAAPAGKVF